MRISLLGLALVVAAPAATVTGRVVERTENGVFPLAGATVTVRAPNRGLRGRGRPVTYVTGVDGLFGFREVPEKGLELLISHPARVVADPLYSPLDPWRLDCASVSCEALEIEMLPGAVVEGRVLDDYGDPMRGVMVMAQRPKEKRVPNRRSTITDDRGVFRLFGLQWGEYDLVVQGPRMTAGVSYVAPITPIDVAPGDEVGGLEIALEASPTHFVRGQVADLPVSFRGGSRIVATRTTGGRTRLRSQAERVDSDGMFHFSALPAGEYWFALQGERRRGPSRRGSGLVSLGVVDVRQDLDGIVLTRRPASGLALQARMADGQDAPRDVRLIITSKRSGAQREIRASFDSEPTYLDTIAGTYRIACDTPGTYVAGLEIRGEPTASNDIKILEGDISDITVVLSQRTATLRGTVRSAGGQTAAKAIVGLRGESGRQTIRAGGDGAFEFDGLPPGNYEVATWPADHMLAGRTARAWNEVAERTVEITVEPGDIVDIGLTVER